MKLRFFEKDDKLGGQATYFTQDGFASCPTIIPYSQDKASGARNQAFQHTLPQSIPGIGPKLACVCIAEIWPISRFASDKKLRRYAGVVPVARQSGDYMGKSRLPKESRRRLLCWAFVVAATAAGRTKTNLGNYYRRKKRQKKIPGKAKMALASTISDIVYRVLTIGEPYTPRAN